jgi:hypothetical protein
MSAPEWRDTPLIHPCRLCCGIPAAEGLATPTQTARASGCTCRPPRQLVWLSLVDNQDPGSRSPRFSVSFISHRVKLQNARQIPLPHARCPTREDSKQPVAARGSPDSLRAHRPAGQAPPARASGEPATVSGLAINKPARTPSITQPGPGARPRRASSSSVGHGVGAPRLAHQIVARPSGAPHPGARRLAHFIMPGAITGQADLEPGVTATWGRLQ